MIYTMRLTETKTIFVVAILAICCSCVRAQETTADADRDRRSIDVGWLLRNLLLNSATASDVKANVTRNIATAPRQPAPATTRRPRPTRPPTTAAPPPPPQPAVHPLINLFAGSSQLWKVPPPTTTTTTTTTTTEEPATLPELLPPARHPVQIPSSHGWNRPIYGDYDYYYPSGYDTYVGRGGQHADPSDYDYADGPGQRALPLPPPSSRKTTRNRQRIATAPSAPSRKQLAIPQSPPPRRRPATTAPAAAPAPAPAPQPQRARVLYEYLQRDDTSFNDADEQPAPPSAAESEADTQQQDDNNGEQDAPGDEAANDGGGNEIPNYDNDSPRAPPYRRQPYAKSSPKSPFGAQSYYNSEPLTPQRFNSYSTGADTGNSGFGGSSFSVRHASPAKGSYQFRDAFSDFETTYDGGPLPSSGIESYKYKYQI